MSPYVWRAAAILAVLVSVASVAAADDTKIVMHAIDHSERVHCFVPEESGYRDPATQTVTSVAGDSETDVFLYLVDYESATGAAFTVWWPETWGYFGWIGDCGAFQITITNHVGSSIEITTAFNEVTGGVLQLLGYASFRTAAAGEVTIGPNTRGCGGLSVACYQGPNGQTPIGSTRLGKVAVGGAGYNPSGPVPVASASWAAIKNHYRAGR